MKTSALTMFSVLLTLSPLAQALAEEATRYLDRPISTNSRRGTAIELMQQDSRRREEQELSGQPQSTVFTSKNWPENLRRRRTQLEGDEAKAECQRLENELDEGDVAECRNAIRIDVYDAAVGKEAVVTFFNNEQLQLIGRKSSHYAVGLPLSSFDEERPQDRLMLGGFYIKGQNPSEEPWRGPDIDLDGDFGFGVSYRFTFGRQRQ